MTIIITFKYFFKMMDQRYLKIVQVFKSSRSKQLKLLSYFFSRVNMAVNITYKIAGVVLWSTLKLSYRQIKVLEYFFYDVGKFITWSPTTKKKYQYKF